MSSLGHYLIYLYYYALFYLSTTFLLGCHLLTTAIDPILLYFILFVNYFFYNAWISFGDINLTILFDLGDVTC